MAFSVGTDTSRRLAPAMNVTPLVDVVLVLLIIFMVLTPMLTKQLWTHIPEKAPAEELTRLQDNLSPIVVRVDLERRVYIGQEAVPAERLAESLARLVSARRDGTVFFDADDRLPYENAVAVMDAARAGGATPLVPLALPLTGGSP